MSRKRDINSGAVMAIGVIAVIGGLASGELGGIVVVFVVLYLVMGFLGIIR